MLNKIDELLKNLNYLKTVYSSVNEVFSERYRLIVSGNVEGLAANVANTGALIVQLKNLESRRQSLLLDISIEENIDISKLNISTLCILCPSKSRQLKKAQKEIVDLLSDIKVSDDRSSRLINNNVEQIRWLLIALREDINDLSIYNGEFSQPTSYSLFDETA